VKRTITYFLPNIKSWIIESCPDTRRQASTEYGIEEIVLSAVFMYVCKSGSRNSLNEDRKDSVFKNNFRCLFGIRLPHMDTVNKVMEKLPPDALENLRNKIIRHLLKKRIWHKQRLKGKYFIVSIDGTGIFKFEEEPYAGCPYTTSKKGKKTYSQSVLEAKIITGNGFSVSLCTEWIINEDGETKQDCEYKASLRLMTKLKKSFPRLPKIIVLDGLYAKEPIMKMIQDYGWHYIIVWKDKTMYRQQDKVKDLREDGEIYQFDKTKYHNKQKKTICEYEYSREGIKYKSQKIWYAKLLETRVDIESQKIEETKFIFMSSLEIENNEDAYEIVKGGRLRWKIENEGFNIQKNNGYGLHHKMNRNNLTAIKNYYICLQIAHLIDQLIQKAKNNNPTKIWNTIKKMFEYFTAFLKIADEIIIEPPPIGRKYNYRY